MVKIEISKDKLKVTGHAGSGEGIHDLVCNSVSVLVQALEIGVNPKFLEVVKKEHGDLEYKIYQPSNIGMTYALLANLKMILDTLRTLANENPEYVEVIEC